MNVLPFKERKNDDSIFYTKTIRLIMLYYLNTARIPRKMRGSFLMSFREMVEALNPRANIAQTMKG